MLQRNKLQDILISHRETAEEWVLNNFLASRERISRHIFKKIYPLIDRTVPYHRLIRRKYSKIARILGAYIDNKPYIRRIVRNDRFKPGVGAALVHIVAISLFIWAIQFTPRMEIPEVITFIGGPFSLDSNTKKIIPKRKDLPLVPPPPVETPSLMDAEYMSPPAGFTNVTKPAEAVASEHAFLSIPDFLSDRSTTITLRLLISITQQGFITNAKVVQSSGNEKLDELACNWVRERWRYRPAMRNGVYISEEAEVLFNFTPIELAQKNHSPTVQ